MQCFLVPGYHGTCHLSLVFPSYTHLPKSSCVRKIQVTHGKFHSIPLKFKHCITSMSYMYVNTTYINFINCVWIKNLFWCLLVFYNSIANFLSIGNFLNIGISGRV